MIEGRLDIYLVYGWKVGPNFVRKAVLTDPAHGLRLVVSADGQRAVLGRVLSSFSFRETPDTVPCEPPDAAMREALRKAASDAGLVALIDEPPQLWIVADHGAWPELKKP